MRRGKYIFSDFVNYNFGFLGAIWHTKTKNNSNNNYNHDDEMNLNKMRTEKTTTISKSLNQKCASCCNHTSGRVWGKYSRQIQHHVLLLAGWLLLTILIVCINNFSSINMKTSSKSTHSLLTPKMHRCADYQTRSLTTHVCVNSIDKFSYWIWCMGIYLCYQFYSFCCDILKRKFLPLRMSEREVNSQQLKL